MSGSKEGVTQSSAEGERHSSRPEKNDAVFGF